ncbi:iron complex outermembrane recepter protein [Janthinobacterium sp. OK676]|uniref:TonB-dependent receptor n=1 Tax=Janthinobacterium sp. OK676 TaxID=1855295 RepID=UPI0008836C0A|nr:TonB-dependent receptor [Janthinobacterium sp. OK676]SDL45992.1 iron complex outermembrane recepter protein [Janthinobacterium sp. OK676]
MNGFKKRPIAHAIAMMMMCGISQAQNLSEEESNNQGKIVEVMVTAQRVAQPASKTPVALSVISGDDLKSAGAVNASSLTDLVPNVQVANSNGATVIAIRGVSSADNTEKGDPSASFNIDGVNIARPQSAGLAFYDLERVEVLRGPQGTLYGRNATAGAINLITNKPADRFEASAAFEVGNYSTRKVDAMLNIKVNDALALRAAVSGSKHDGYLRSTQGLQRDFDDEDTISGRIHALLKLAPSVSLLLSADSSEMRGAGPYAVPVTSFLSSSGDAQRTATPDIQGEIHNRAQGYSAELKADVGLGELVYQAAHRSYDRDEVQPFGFGLSALPTYTYADASYTQNSHELRLASTFGAFRTIAGLYWFKEQSRLDFQVLNFPDLGELRFVQDPTISKSKAAFGDLTYSVSPDLRLTIGARRTKDDKSRQGFSLYGNPVVARDVNDAAVSYAQTTGKLGIDYTPSKSVMLYTTLSSGYKAGGFNDGTTASNPFLTYDPEKLTSLEAGVKGRFLNNSLQLTAAIFRYDYKNLQLTSLVADPVNGAVTQQTRNAAKAKISGVELEGKYAITNNDKIDFSLTYLDSTYENYHPTTSIDWSGARLDKSPRSSVGLGYTHHWDLASGASVSGHIGTRYSSSYVLSDFSIPRQYRQDGFHKSDATLTYTPAAGAWYVQAYVRNIEDKNVMTSYTAQPIGNVSIAPPRLAGLRVGATF